EGPQPPKPKKSTWKFNLDLTHTVEDGIFDSGNFEQFPCSTTGEATTMRSPRTTTKSGPCSLQLEKARTQQRRPNTAKNK
uniref:Uncharacterized protein n=1 Tax=Balaenoptera musculus TaxID=9771 RepID=A0A8C0HUH2_BALMU